MTRFKVDEYKVWEKGREHSVLVFPFVKHMWAFDDYPEENCYMVDGSAEAFSKLKYALAILVEASDKIIYFPCRQEGIGRYYRDNYNLILCTPKAQLRRSLWIAIRRKLNASTRKGSYTLQYDRKKLDDFCEKKLLEKHCWGREEKYYPRDVVRKRKDAEHLEEVIGENLFMVLGQTECYFCHYRIAKDLDELEAGNRYGPWSALGWIFPQKHIAEMYKRAKEEAEAEKEGEQEYEFTGSI